MDYSRILEADLRRAAEQAGLRIVRVYDSHVEPAGSLTMTPVFVRLLHDAAVSGDFDVVALHTCGQLGVNDAWRYRNTFLLKHMGLQVFEAKHGRASFRDGWSAILGSVRGRLTRKQCGELEEAVCWTSKEQYVEALTLFSMPLLGSIHD